jgi:glyoxylase-like metal-dependent hydrolase (beta-lactamase superfamily II)
MSHWTVTALLEGTGYSSSCTLLTNDAVRVLVDTGLMLQEGALLDALDDHGVAPADIDLVINTHLHIDHCGNNALFTRAAIIMSRAEWRWTDAFYTALFTSRAPEVVTGEFYPELAAHHVKPRTIRNVARLARMFWRRERLGRESQFRWAEEAEVPAGLELLETPGHTPHHLSIRVNASVPVVVAGDAVLAEDPAARVRTMIPHSQVQFAATRQRLLDLGVRIIPGHGRAFQPPRAPGAEPGVRP